MVVPFKSVYENKNETKVCYTTITLFSSELSDYYYHYEFKNIRFRHEFNYEHIPIKKLTNIIYKFEIKKYFLFIPYWYKVGNYFYYKEGLEECCKLLDEI